MPNRVVKSAGYYQSMLQSKIEEIAAEIDRLHSEAEMADSESEPRRALEKKHRDLATSVQDLEAQLADFNLAREHARSGVGVEDIRRSTLAMDRGNTKTEEEIDAVFFSRKEVEEEEKRVQAELQAIHDTVIKANLLHSKDGDEDVHEYRALVKDIDDVIAETKRIEDDAVLLQHKMKKTTNGSEYAAEKKRIEELKQRLERAEDDIQLAQMTEGEAEQYLVAKVGDLRYQTKKLNEASAQTKMELKTLHEMGRGLRSELRTMASGGHERLIRKEQKVKRFLEKLPEKKAALEEERARLTASIESLRSDVRKNDKMAATELPSKEEMQLMKEEALFTGKQLDANQETIALLQRQKEARAEELNKINTLEERIASEMEELAKQTAVLRKEIESYENLDGLRESADATRLMEKKDKLVWGIQLLDDLLEEPPDKLESSPKWRELLDVKSKLRGQELPQEAEAATEYGNIKADCLRLAEEINQAIILSQ